MKTYKRIYPTEEEPRFGQRFIVKGLQFINIDQKYTPMTEMTITKRGGVPVIFEIGKSYSEWRKIKQKISDDICTLLSNSKCKRTAFFEPAPNMRDVVAMTIEYLSEPGCLYVV